MLIVKSYLRTVSVQTERKISQIVPVRYIGPTAIVNNYRPINAMSKCGKEPPIIS